MTDSLVASEPVHSYKYFDVSSLFAAACMFFFVFGTGFMVGAWTIENLSSGFVNNKGADQPDQPLNYLLVGKYHF